MKDVLGEKLAEAMEIDSLSERDRQKLFERIGGVAITAAVSRLLGSLDESEGAKLQLYLDTHQNEDVYTYLLKTYPRFDDLLDEEVKGLQTDIASVVL
jgi:hypothetical protein